MKIKTQSLARKWAALALFGCALFVASCTKDDPKTELPTTYNFSNVNYSGQTERLNMLDELMTEVKKTNAAGVTLNLSKVKDMFANQNNPFSFSSTKQLKDKCFSLDQALFEAYFDSLYAASQSSVAGANGVAGVVTSADGTKKYLFNAKGFEYAQLIEKGLMGAVCYYQATSVYLSDDKMNVDNQTVTEGEGTAMQHHWDEAFGYLGVPIDFPANTTGARYHGKYAAAREAVLKSGTDLMKALIKGRDAIGRKDMTARNEAIAEVRAAWEKMIAGTAVSYLNQAKANLADNALRNHALSECVAFIRSLKYNPERKISDAQMEEVLNHIGPNLYNVTTDGLNNAIDLLSQIYGLDSVKSQL